MEPICAQFIEKLMNESNFLKKIGVETIEYWRPDSPPVIILFASIGNELARQFNNLRNEEKLAIFQHIEEGIRSNDIALKTAVATGIIEGIISTASQDEELWSRIESQLGEVSKCHALAWIEK